MQEYLEVTKSLRNLLRRSDRFGYDLERLKWEILSVAENYEDVADRIEMEMIIQMQNDMVECG
jgi:hypothetical protein